MQITITTKQIENLKELWLSLWANNPRDKDGMATIDELLEAADSRVTEAEKEAVTKKRRESVRLLEEMHKQP